MLCMLANSQYIPRIVHPPEESYFLLGPSRDWKIKLGFSTSTLKRPESIYCLVKEERRFSAYPEKIRDVAAALPEGSTLILDEIQRVPRLLPEIHSLIEEKKGIQYIMTGSSSRKLRRSVSDLLGGRALLRQMGPFLASELKGNFSLEKAIKTGLIPLIWESHPSSAAPFRLSPPLFKRGGPSRRA